MTLLAFEFIKLTDVSLLATRDTRSSGLPARFHLASGRLSPPDDSTGRRGGLVVDAATGRLNIGGADVD
jgi:hypothetical protein